MLGFVYIMLMQSVSSDWGETLNRDCVGCDVSRQP